MPESTRIFNFIFWLTGQLRKYILIRPFPILLFSVPFIAGQSLQPTNPMREYIRLGGRVIAIENRLEPTTITITPSTPSPIRPGESLAFSASGSGASGGVTWSISRPFGTIVPTTGLYTAPLATEVQQQESVTVTATSVAVPSVTANVVVVVNPVIVPANVNIPSNGRSGTVAITTSGSWTASSNSGWLRITTGASGSDSGTLEYTADPNAGEPRTGTIEIKVTENGSETAHLFSVSQTGGHSSVTFTPSGAVVAAAAGTGTINVSVTGTTSWTAAITDGGEWLLSVSPGSGTSSATLTYTFAANTNTTTRTGRITIAGQDFVVMQQGQTQIVPSSVDLPHTAGSSSFQVVAPPGHSWTATMICPVTADCAWRRFKPGGYFGTGIGVVQFDVDPNEGFDGRSGQIEVDGQRFTINQAGKPSALQIAPSTVYSLLTNSTQQFVASLNGGPNVNGDCDWTLSIPSPNGGTITQSGLYTAPTSVQAGGLTVTVTARHRSTGLTATATLLVNYYVIPGEHEIDPRTGAANAGQTVTFLNENATGGPFESRNYEPVEIMFTGALVPQGQAPPAADSCLIRFHLISRLMSLDGAGTTPIGQPGVLENPQCRVLAHNSAVTFDNEANPLHVRIGFAVQFSGSFVGTKHTYLHILDNLGNTRHSWDRVGSWTVLPANDAAVVSISAPTAVLKGSTFEALVKMKNTGGRVWTSSEQYRLGSQMSQDNSTWGKTRVELPTSTVAINSEAEFRFQVTAPPTSGAQPFAWKMVQDGVEWFGPIASTQINVTGPEPATVSIQPASGKGYASTFTAKYADANGGTDIQHAYLLINSQVTGPDGCHIRYTRADDTFSLQLNNGQWSTPSVRGSGADLNNDQCTIKPSASSVLVAHTDLTFSIPVVFSESFGGTKNTYLWVQDNEGNQAATYEHRGTWTINSPAVPISVTPNSGAGARTTFTATFEDGDGTNDIVEAYVLFNSTISSASSCQVWYSPGENVTRLLNDSATSWSILGPGGAPISNSQCTIRSFQRLAPPNERSLQIAFDVEFASSYAGRRNLYLLSKDTANVTRGWLELGSWIALGKGQAPTVYIDQPGPATYTGIVNIAGWAIDSGGRPESAIHRVEIYIDGVKLPSNANYGIHRADVCIIYPDRPGCPNVGFSYGWDSRSVVNGQHTIRVMAFDSEAPANSSFAESVITVANPIPPVTVSVSPVSGAGMSTTLTARYADQNGAADLNLAYVLVNTELFPENGCYIEYERASNTVRLLGNDGITWSVPSALGSGSPVSNTQCTVRAAGSSASTAGNELTLSVAIDFTTAFAGNKNVYLYAKDNSGAWSGPTFDQRGTWNVGSFPSASSAGPAEFNITATTGTINVYAYGVQNATAVRFPTWSLANGQDDLIWYEGVNLGNGTWKATVNLASHPGLGQIAVSVYLYNGSTEVGLTTLSFFRQSPSWPAPVAGGIPTGGSGAPAGFTLGATSGTLDFYAFGVQNATAVFFPAWSVVNGQDDLVWYPGTNLGNGTWKGTVNLATHPGNGQIVVNVWMVNGATVLPLADLSFFRNP